MESSGSESATNHANTGGEFATGVLPSKGNPPRPRLHAWAIALAAGVAAGLVSWLAGEGVHGIFRPQVFPVKVVFITYIQPTIASLNAADLKNATLVFTILGAVTGLAMGIAGGLVGRSLSRGLVVGLGGLAAGGLVGGLASLGLLPLSFRRVVPNPNDLLSPILIHAGIWMAIGAVGGLAFAVGMRCARRSVDAVVCACLGAFLATLVYHGLGEALFPDAGSTELVATSTFVRFLAVFLVTVLISCGAVKGALGRISGPASSGT
jgi:hypothetical protein